MKILVTGGTGYIGTRLGKYLADRGEHVRLFGLPMPNADVMRHDRIEVLEGNILDRSMIQKAMAGCNRVYHLAAYARNWAKDSGTFCEVNVEGTRNVLETAFELCVNKVLFTSSNVTYGPSNGSPVNECTRRTVPFFTEYERSKAIAEQLVRQYVQRGLHAVIVNPTRVFGPGALTESNSATKMICRYVQGKWRLILGDGRAKGNYVFVDDLVKGHALAMEHGRPGENYILGGENISFEEFFVHLAAAAGRQYRMFHLPASIALAFSRFEQFRATWFQHFPMITPGWVKTFMADWVYSSDKAQHELGYTITPFGWALKRTLEWFESEIGLNTVLN